MRQVLFRLALPGTERVLTLYGFGAMMCLGFLAAILLAARRAKRLNQPPETISNIALFCFFGGIGGARLFYVIQFHHQVADWWEVFRIWEGGLTYYGGLALASAAVIAYLWLSRLPVLYWVDITAPSLALGLAFGRMGCFLNGCCYGDVSGAPWAFSWPVGSIPWHHYAEGFLASQGVGFLSSGGPRLGAAMGSVVATWQAPAIHPSQLYSLVNAGLLCLVLHVMFGRKRRHGQVFLFFVLLYAISRFLLEFLRADEASAYLLGLPTLLASLGFEGAASRLPGLTISQNVAIVMAAASAWGLAWLFRTTRRDLRADHVPPTPLVLETGRKTSPKRRKGKNR